MEKENVLEIEFQKVWDNKWAWRIIKNEIKLDREKRYITHNSVRIEKQNKDTIFIYDEYVERYLDIEDDILLDLQDIEKIKKFVDFVNEEYGIPKRWRAEKNKTYFLINYYGHVCDVIEENIERDNEFFEQGNYFKTLEEAEKVKAELDKFWAKVRAGEIGKWEQRLK